MMSFIFTYGLPQYQAESIIATHKTFSTTAYQQVNNVFVERGAHSQLIQVGKGI
jgi:hypothetical protein